MSIRISYLSLFLLLIAVVVLSGCKKSYQIPEKQLIKIYAEMIFMQDTSLLSQPVIKNKVLKRFKTSESDYEKTIKYYIDNPEKWQKFFDSAIVYIERLKPKPKKNEVKSLRERSLSGDKKNL